MQSLQVLDCDGQRVWADSRKEKLLPWYLRHFWRVKAVRCAGLWTAKVHNVRARRGTENWRLREEFKYLNVEGSRATSTSTEKLISKLPTNLWNNYVSMQRCKCAGMNAQNPSFDAWFMSSSIIHIMRYDHSNRSAHSDLLLLSLRQRDADPQDRLTLYYASCIPQHNILPFNLIRLSSWPARFLYSLGHERAVDWTPVAKGVKTLHSLMQT